MTAPEDAATRSGRERFSSLSNSPAAAFSAGRPLPPTLSLIVHALIDAHPDPVPVADLAYSVYGQRDGEWQETSIRKAVSLGRPRLVPMNLKILADRGLGYRIAQIAPMGGRLGRGRA